jgi:hypothetical protein
MEWIQPYLLMLGIAGMLAGFVAFVHGLGAYRREAVVGSIATSSVDGLAAGEIRLTGTVKPLAVTLVSALQSATCVWYHSKITEGGDPGRVLLDEQRSIDFLLDDGTGSVRVVPRGLRARIDPAFNESTDVLGVDPIGVDRREGAGSMVAGQADHDAAVADLLTVRPPAHDLDDQTVNATLGFAGFGMGFGTRVRSPGHARRHYIEERIAPGDRITIVGQARPYSEVDPIGPDATADLDPTTFDDPTLVSELEEARATGALAGSAREAWGNAAIPGFGIGKPTERPVLEAGATPEEPVTSQADAAQAAHAAHAPGKDEATPATLDAPPPETLVIATSDSTPLTVYAGTPTEAVAFDRDAFYRGLAGGALAIVCAVAIAATWTGGF